MAIVEVNGKEYNPEDLDANGNPYEDAVPVDHLGSSNNQDIRKYAKYPKFRALTKGVLQNPYAGVVDDDSEFEGFLNSMSERSLDDIEEQVNSCVTGVDWSVTELHWWCGVGSPEEILEANGYTEDPGSGVWVLTSP